jgi:predicted GIY-YIG superfamily endonuclease
VKTYVYFIQAGKGHIKIGVSKDPEARLKDLQVGSSGRELVVLATLPFNTRAEAFEMEKYLHTELARFRINGEWFKRNITRYLKSGGKRVIGGTHNNPIKRLMHERQDTAAAE